MRLVIAAALVELYVLSGLMAVDKFFHQHM